MFNIKEYTKQYYEDHKKAKKEYDKQYYKNHKEKIKEQHKFRYQINGEKQKEYNKQQYGERRKWLDNYKLSRGCSICGYNKCASALDFHHINEKFFEISIGMRNRMNLEKIKTEINKCVVICRNCHSELHEKERKNILNNS